MSRTIHFQSFLLTTLFLFVGLLVLHAGDVRSVAHAGPQQETAGNWYIYLPMAQGGGVTTPPPPPPPPQSYEGAFFASTDWKTASADIETDAQGGMHLAYRFYEAVDGTAPTYAVYLYCPTNCDDGANWNGVYMGEQVTQVQLALTSNGRPRVLYRSNGEYNGNDFFYAACDGNDCTDPMQWELTWVTSNRGMSVSEFNDDTLPQRYFALDPQDRPRFIYSDRDTWVEPDHLGTFYAFCDQNCTQGSNWFETRINRDNGNEWNYRYEKFNYPALAFTPAGQPRVLADGISMEDEFYLYYLACDTGCSNSGNWGSVPLFDRGSGPHVSYDIEINAQGQPRAAFFEGALLGGQGDRLYYTWCNNGCFNGSGWQRSSIGLNIHNGRGPDLELDAAGRPRLAYAQYDGGGLGYAWCNSNCETVGATWQQLVVESGNDLLAAWPVAYPPHCSGGFWDGRTPTLSLDSAGNPRFAYDATYHARCWYNPDTGQWEPWSQMHLIWRAVRWVFFDQP